MKIFLDNFKNKATIEELKILPFAESKTKEKAFRLCLYSLYDNNFLYFVSVYESIEEAINKLKNFSCGTFKEV